MPIIKPSNKEIDRFIDSGVARIPLAQIELDDIDGSYINLAEMEERAREELTIEQMCGTEEATKFSVPAYVWTRGHVDQFLDRSAKIYIASLRINPENIPENRELLKPCLTKRLEGLSIVLGDLIKGHGYSWKVTPVYFLIRS
jgi:hypothetical protein